MKNSGCGILKLALPLGRESYILSTILPEFYKKYPNVEVKLTEGSSRELVNSVQEGISDLVIINEPSFPLHINYEILGYEKMLLVVPKNSKWAKFVTFDKDKKAYIDLKYCHDAPFILHRPNQHSGQIERIIFRNAGLKPKILLETKNLAASYYLATSGQGLTFLSEYHISNSMNNSATYNCIVDDPITNMGIIIGYKNKKELSFLAKEFVNISREIIKNNR